MFSLLGTAVAADNGTIVVPGGLAEAAQVAQLEGLRNDSGNAESGLDRLFAHLLRLEASPGAFVQVNPARMDLLSYLAQRARLEQHLRKEKLNATDIGIDQSRELTFPLNGASADIQPARRLLSFFGIRFNTIEAADQTRTIPESAPNRRRNAPMGERLLRILDPEFFEDPAPTEIRFTLRDERRPIILDAETWNDLLPGKGNDLFRRFISSPEGMHLYLALAACSPATRRILAETATPKQLLKAAVALRLFGRDLQFNDGALLFPGSSKAWIGYLETQGDAPAAVLERILGREGTPLLLYAAIAGAAAPVQEVLTRSPERLRALAEIIKPYTAGNSSASLIAAVGRDLGRILRMSVLRGDELFLDLDAPLASRLLHWAAPKLVQPESLAPIPLSPQIISKLLPRKGVSPLAETSRAGVIEFFRYLQSAQPEAISPESAELLLKAPESAPILLDLIGNLRPDAATMFSYLRYCFSTMSGGRRGWNVNRTRTSQALFFIISALSREQALSQPKATAFLQRAIDVLSVDDEALFANGAAEFLSALLLPELSAQRKTAADPLLAALSGADAKSRIHYQGSNLVFDRAARRRRSMADAMQSQSYTPLSILLELYDVLREIDRENDQGKLKESWRIVRERLGELRTAEWTPGASPDDQDEVALIRLDDIKARMDVSAGAGLAKGLAAELHSELGVSLLTYCYAYSGGPAIDVMTFDPNFVRKHRFYRRSARPPTWVRAHFEQEDALGGLMEGSVVGLEFELAKLETAQANNGAMGSRIIDLAPAILYGVRRVEPALRTDRSQEYVALGTRLGGMLIDLARSNQGIARRILEFKPSSLPQARLESDSGALSRSELFLLGHEYFKTGSRDLCGEQPPSSASHCSVLSRLDEIVPRYDQPDHAAFQQEVDQYGMLLRGRIGLSRLSFQLMEPYELLGDNLSPESLYDRICDLKIRIAELNHAAGIPAALGGMEASMALLDVLPSPHDSLPFDWRATIDRINQLDMKLAPGWIRELVDNGTLIPDDGRSEVPHL